MLTGQFLIPLMSGFVITVIFMPLFIGYLRFKKEDKQFVMKVLSGTLRKTVHQRWVGWCSSLPQ